MTPTTLTQKGHCLDIVRLHYQTTPTGDSYRIHRRTGSERTADWLWSATRKLLTVCREAAGASARTVKRLITVIKETYVHGKAR
jgi:hypothetical protein